MWKKMTANEKKLYDAKATLDKERYTTEMKVYKEQNPNGERTFEFFVNALRIQSTVSSVVGHRV